MTAHRSEEPMSSCLSEYRLDRHLLGLESAEEKAEAEAHIAQCALCAGEVKAWHAAHAAPVRLPAPLPEAESSWWEQLQALFVSKGALWMPVASAACALVVLFWIARPGEEPFAPLSNTPQTNTRPLLYNI